MELNQNDKLLARSKPGVHSQLTLLMASRMLACKVFVASLSACFCSPRTACKSNCSL